MKISIIFPTRTRTNQVQELIDTIEETADDFDEIEFCIYYDNDDIESKKFLYKASCRFKNLKYIT
jgi:hypothetical protein